VNATKANAGEEAVKKDRQHVTALARGLQVLRCFDAERTVLSTAEIARLTGLPQPTVWRLCHTLIEEGYLVQLARDQLRPGIPVLSLGYAAIAATPIAELARAEMQEIATRHQGAVSLGTREGAEMIYLQRCQGSQIIMKSLQVGSRVPLLASATGWAYIAGLPEPQRRQLFEELRASEPQQLQQFLPVIRRALEGYAESGYVVNIGVFHAQIHSVAVPVRSQDGSMLLSLSAGGIKEQFTRGKLKRVGADLKALAAQLGAALTARTGTV